MPLKSFFIATFLFFTCAITYAQDTTYYFKTREDSINAIANAIRNHKTIETSMLGIVGMPSRQFCRFLFLLRLCSDKDLEKLTNDGNKCIKLYAYLGLFYRKYPMIDSIKRALSTDSSIVYAHETDVVGIAMPVWEATKEILPYFSGKETGYFSQLVDNPRYKNLFFAALLNEKIDEFTLE